MAGIWKSGCKVQRESRSGLKFPDIFSSWSAFKFSWFRRIAKSNNSWKEIFVHNLSRLNVEFNIFFTDLDTIEYTRITKKFQNSFWSNWLNVIKPFVLEHIKMHPDNILFYPLWGSSIFMRASNECKNISLAT